MGKCSMWVGVCVAMLAGPAWGQQRTPYDARVMSARIDQLIAAKWREKGVVPAELADDAEFFRRLSIDLNGRIPSLTQLKDFLDDPRPNKRVIWAEILMRDGLATEPYANRVLFLEHMTNYWRTLLFSQTTNQQAQVIGFQLEPFLRRHLLESHGDLPRRQHPADSPPSYEDMVRSDKPLRWDVIVRELLTTQGGSFYQASENRPETIAGATSRLLLGVRLECAQCHDDRSGGNWTRTQFWEYAAFFANFQPARPGRPMAQPPAPTSGAPKIKIPDKEIWVEARFLDNVTPEWVTGTSPQEVLARWMTARDNRFFARAAVNRMWYYLLGTGLTDPVDHMAANENPASHPELLDELAEQFAANDFDLKWLMRAIIGSRPYQLTSKRSHPSQDDDRLFARMAVRGMSPEQLYESILAATGISDAGPRQPGRIPGFNPNTPRSEFLARFTNTTDKRTELQTSILQALFLMNGKFINDSLKTSPALLNIQKAKVNLDRSPVTVERKLTELYLISLSRKPTSGELAKLGNYVSGGETSGRSEEAALADVFWALLNSSEFGLNH